MEKEMKERREKGKGHIVRCVGRNLSFFHSANTIRPLFLSPSPTRSDHSHSVSFLNRAHPFSCCFTSCCCTRCCCPSHSAAAATGLLQLVSASSYKIVAWCTFDGEVTKVEVVLSVSRLPPHTRESLARI